MPYRQVDVSARRANRLREARRIRDALAAAERFHCIGRDPRGGWRIGSSQEIIDALDGLIEELEV